MTCKINKADSRSTCTPVEFIASATSEALALNLTWNQL